MNQAVDYEREQFINDSLVGLKKSKLVPDKVAIKKPQAHLKEFFNEDVDSKIIDVIQVNFNSYRNKKMAILIFTERVLIFFIC